MPPTVARYEPRGLSKPAIYTFLGLASLPRFRGRSVDGPRAANPLRLLPREMVLHIARFAYRAGYHAHWVQFCNDEEIAVALDVTDTSHVTRLSCMVSSKTYYVEVRFSYAWWGTGLDILALAGLAQPEGQRKFRFMLEHNDGVGGHDNGHIAVLERNVVGDMLDMPSLGVDSWSYCQDPVTMSVLVDMVRGRDIWSQWSRRSLRSLSGGRHVAERCPGRCPKLSPACANGRRSISGSMHCLVRNSADPAFDAGGGEPS